LAGWGLEATAVAGGSEALTRLREAAAANQPYSVVIWEAGVSDVSKEDFASTVNSSPELGKVTLILLTPLGVVQDLQRLRKLGFAECVTKPIMQSSLLDALQVAIAGDSSERPRQRMGRKDVPQVDAIPRTAHKGARILLAEDNEINQQVALEVLAHAGYQCDAVGDGRQAVDAIRSTHYDLILMDCQMPEMDGFAATREIRERERLMVQDALPIPIIALTANAFKGEQERCLAAGMTDYVSKPFEPFQLVRTIELCLDRVRKPGEEQTVASVPCETPVPNTPTVSAEPQVEPAESFVWNEELAQETSEELLPVVDFDSLLKRCLGNRELPKKLLTKFHARLPQELTQLAAAVTAGDCAQVSALAHRLKGAAANLSAEPLREAATELESLGRNGDLTDADIWVARLSAEGSRFLREVPRLAAEKTNEWQKSDAVRDASLGEMQCVS
jgi:Amt family ammonium transporter